MAEDWQVGDLALCIKQGAWKPVNGSPPYSGPSAVLGGIYQVTRARIAHGNIVLDLAEFPNVAHAAYRFRKIRPHAPDVEDIETIALLNGQPVRETV